MKNTILTTLALATTLLVGGCAAKQLETEVAQLADQVATLESENEKLAEHRELLCIAITEIVGGGMYMYVGNGKWKTIMGTLEDMPEDFMEGCIKSTEEYKKEIERRAAVEAAEKKLSEASK